MATCGLGRWAKGLYLFSGCSDFPASGPPSWARAWKVTGMVISADWVADLGNGASTVSVPSGDREEETRVGSTPGGSLDGQRGPWHQAPYSHRSGQSPYSIVAHRLTLHGLKFHQDRPFPFTIHGRF